jgi:hypothetical protein
MMDFSLPEEQEQRKEKKGPDYYRSSNSPAMKRAKLDASH